MEIKSRSEKETKEIGKNIAKRLAPGAIIALYGDLGSGKTTLVQGVASGLGIKKRVLSPTFVFMRSYAIQKNHQEFDLVHIDLYRGEEASDFKSLGLEDIFDSQSIVILEWAEKIKKVLPKKRIEIYIKVDKQGARRLSITELK